MGKGPKNDMDSTRNTLDGYVIRLKKAGGESVETTSPHANDQGQYKKEK